MAAYIQLFRVNPVHLTVQKILVFVFGELLFAFPGNRPDIQVVLAHISHIIAIGREFGVVGRVGRRGELDRRPALQLE